jgi:hypothetical protein
MVARKVQVKVRVVDDEQSDLSHFLVLWFLYSQWVDVSASANQL